MMFDKINLANGTSVTWEEFSRWGAIKQYQSILPNRKGVPHTPETREKISQSLKLYYSLYKNNKIKRLTKNARSAIIVV